MLNHTRVGPLSVVGKALHMISFGTPYKCMRVLNDSRWSRGSFDPSHASTCGILNLAGRGKDVTGAVKGELVRWTSSSKLVDTRPFRAFIIISIFSFIVCISCAIRRLPTRNDDWYFASPIYSWHCFPLGHPSLDGFSFGDNFCHVRPYSTRRFDRFAPDHSTTPTVIPTHRSIE